MITRFVAGGLVLLVICVVAAAAACASRPREAFEPAVQRRTRSVLVPEAHGGKPCPVLSETKSCPPVDCTFRPWGGWKDECHHPGVKALRRTRSIASAARHGGLCGPTEETKPCPPVDCTLGPWGDWDDKCGHRDVEDIRRTRAILSASKHGGKCGPVEQTKPCPAVDCLQTKFGGWQGDCAKEGDRLSRTRDLLTEPRHGGKPCGPAEETKPCGPIDCKLSQWGGWESECGYTTRDGKQTTKGDRMVRFRRVEVAPRFGGRQCGPLEESKACAPIDCVVGDWDEGEGNTQEIRAKGWLDKCDGPEKALVRTRPILAEPKFGGKSCPAVREEKPCVPVDCEVTKFHPWDDSWCSLTESERAMSGVTGFESPVPYADRRQRDIVVDPKRGGKACPVLLETRACPKSIKCRWGPWTSETWPGPHKECSSGQVGLADYRYLTNERQFVNAGLDWKKECPDHVRVPWCRSCTKDSRFTGAGRRCKPGGYYCNGYKDCNQPTTNELFGHTRARDKVSIYYDAFPEDGKDHPDPDAKVTIKYLAEDCQYSNWSQGKCDKECGGGIRKDTRTQFGPYNGGKACPPGPLERSEPCNEFSCGPEYDLTCTGVRGLEDNNNRIGFCMGVENGRVSCHGNRDHCTRIDNLDEISTLGMQYGWDGQCNPEIKSCDATNRSMGRGAKFDLGSCAELKKKNPYHIDIDRICP